MPNSSAVGSSVISRLFHCQQLLVKASSWSGPGVLGVLMGLSHEVSMEPDEAANHGGDGGRGNDHAEQGGAEQGWQFGLHGFNNPACRDI